MLYRKKCLCYRKKRMGKKRCKINVEEKKKIVLKKGQKQKIIFICCCFAAYMYDDAQ
jgi:hypothetical protein